MTDLDSLIESEAVALTEDAIFFAKKELYQEISAAERLVQETADKLVSKSINSALIELYSDRNSMESSDSDDRESPAQLLTELPDPADFVYTAIDVAGDPHGMLRLDSIAEESEHSECSLRSSSSNNLGLMQTINEPAGINAFRNTSYGQESVEIAEYFNNPEQQHEHVTPSPIKMFIHQGSLQHQPSVDSALSDAESRSLLGGNNSPYFRPQSPTPPASRLSGDNHRNRAMAWTREESRDWRSSDDDSAQESIGTSPLFNRVQKRNNPFPFGSRSSTMDLDDGPIEPVFEAQVPVNKPQAGLNWFSMTLDEDDENNNLVDEQNEIPEFQNAQNADQAIDFEVASSIASFVTVIERENEHIEDVNLDETTSTASSASIIYLKDEKEESVDYNYPASDDFDVVQVQPPTPTDGQSRALSPDFNNNEEQTVIQYDYSPPTVERKQSVADLLVEKMEAQLSSTTTTSSSVLFSVDEPSGTVAPPGETQFDKFLEDVERDFSLESDAETSISNETAVEKISDIESNNSEQENDLVAHVSHAVQEMDMLAKMLDNIANDLVASCLDDVIHSELFGQKDSETRKEIKRKLSAVEIADEFDPIPRESTGENEGLKRRDTGIHDLIGDVSAPPAKRSSLEIFEEEEEEEEEKMQDHFARPNESSLEKEEPTFSTFINEDQSTIKATEPICEYMTVGGDDADANETMREFGFQNPYFDMSKSASVDSGSRGDTNEQISSPAIFTSEAQQVTLPF